MATEQICSIENCGNKCEARSLCKRHYRRWLRDGNDFDKSTNAVPRGPVGARKIFQDVLKDAKLGQCLLWPKNPNKDGYGFFKRAGKTILAHREICRLAHGEPPSPGHHAAHSCDNRMCVSRFHLRWATLQENIADRQDRQRQQRGSHHYRAKLVEADIPVIRRRLESGEAPRVIAHDFGVSTPAIDAVRWGKTWRHVA